MAADAGRRGVLIGGASFAGASVFPRVSQGAANMVLGADEPFSFELLVQKAKRLASSPYEGPPAPDPGLAAIDFDAYGQINFDASRTIWGHDGEPAIRLFPLGKQFTAPVRINLLSQGTAKQVLYSPTLFTTPPGHPFRRLRGAGGFAGFRVLNADHQSDWLAFLGASYFRTAGPFNQYGSSARGLAINSGGPAAEEFPRFTEFWLEMAPRGGLIAYALLDSPSVAGAYRFDNRRTDQGVFQGVDVTLFFRRPVETLGIAPITSMFWYGKDNPPATRDWRPEIHDSDGLALFTGAGERIWRPLTNPPRVITNAFADNDPKGFGLMQRDRSFDHYQDDGVFYEKRPDVWIEPRAPFGPGSVRLVELPSSTETDDNMGAFWTPQAPIVQGDVRRFAYEIQWIGQEPGLGSLARVVATRSGRGGRPGLPAPPGSRRFAVDFVGDGLKGLDRLHGAEAVVTSTNDAKVEQVSAYGVVGADIWRILFDVQVLPGGPTNLRAFLRSGSRTLSETWIYQVFGA